MPTQQNQSEPTPPPYSSGAGSQHDPNWTGSPKAKKKQEAENQSKLGRFAEFGKNTATKSAILGGVLIIGDYFINAPKLADAETWQAMGNADTWTAPDGLIDPGAGSDGVIDYVTGNPDVMGADFGTAIAIGIGAVGAYGAYLVVDEVFGAVKSIKNGLGNAYDYLKEKISGKKEEPEVETSNSPSPSP